MEGTPSAVATSVGRSEQSVTVTAEVRKDLVKSPS
jgi:hypothetical protein